MRWSRSHAFNLDDVSAFAPVDTGAVVELEANSVVSSVCGKHSCCEQEITLSAQLGFSVCNIQDVMPSLQFELSSAKRNNRYMNTRFRLRASLKKELTIVANIYPVCFGINKLGLWKWNESPEVVLYCVSIMISPVHIHTVDTRRSTECQG